jgi:hypothetical protein
MAARPMARSGPHGPATARGWKPARRGHHAPADSGGAAAAGLPVAAADEGLHSGHQSSEGMAPGKVVRVEAHQGTLPTTRGALAAVLNGGCEL